jgi:hypothetical protein
MQDAEERRRQELASVEQELQELKASSFENSKDDDFMRTFVGHFSAQFFMQIFINFYIFNFYLF